MNIDSNRGDCEHGLALFCEWKSDTEGDTADEKYANNAFCIPFPLKRAIEVLRLVSTAPKLRIDENVSDFEANIRNHDKEYLHILFTEQAENIDFNSFAVHLMEQIKTEQARSAFAVIRAALASVLDLTDESGQMLTLKHAETCPGKGKAQADAASTLEHKQSYNDAFKLICDGLFLAVSKDELRQEAMALLKGLATHIFYVVTNFRKSITRVDSDGCDMESFHSETLVVDAFEAHNHILDGKMQPLKPFGSFRVTGPLERGVDPFVFNRSLADSFSDTNLLHTQSAATDVLELLFELFQQSSCADSTAGTKPYTDSTALGGEIIFENLLSELCEICFSKAWNFKSGIMSAVLNLMNKMGLQWCKQYEVEVLHTALFLVKNAPNDVTLAGKESLSFFTKICWFFFEGPKSWKDSKTLIYDVLCPSRTQLRSESGENEHVIISEASLTLLLSELSSTSHLVR